jgi:hypothetical protein
VPWPAAFLFPAGTGGGPARIRDAHRCQYAKSRRGMSRGRETARGLRRRSSAPGRRCLRYPRAPRSCLGREAARGRLSVLPRARPCRPSASPRSSGRPGTRTKLTSCISTNPRQHERGACSATARCLQNNGCW